LTTISLGALIGAIVLEGSPPVPALLFVIVLTCGGVLVLFLGASALKQIFRPRLLREVAIEGAGLLATYRDGSTRWFKAAAPSSGESPGAGVRVPGGFKRAGLHHLERVSYWPILRRRLLAMAVEGERKRS